MGASGRRRWLGLLFTAICLLSPFLSKMAWAGGAHHYRDCYYYGTEQDGHLGKPTAFADWRDGSVPGWLPLEVRDDWPGVAVRGLRPGAVVRLTVVDLPGWAGDELRAELVGRSILAVVADRPGGDYVDCWPLTFSRLTGGRTWVGKVYVEITEKSNESR